MSALTPTILFQGAGSKEATESTAHLKLYQRLEKLCEQDKTLDETIDAAIEKLNDTVNSRSREYKDKGTWGGILLDSNNVMTQYRMALQPLLNLAHDIYEQTCFKDEVIICNNTSSPVYGFNPANADKKIVDAYNNWETKAYEVVGQDMSVPRGHHSSGQVGQLTKVDGLFDLCDLSAEIDRKPSWASSSPAPQAKTLG